MRCRRSSCASMLIRCTGKCRADAGLPPASTTRLTPPAETAMTTYIGLLRAVNLGPHNRVGMKDLAALMTMLGMQDVRTLLASGNVVFRSDNGSAETLEKLFKD